MKTEAQKRAAQKYRAERAIMLSVQLNRHTDADIIARVSEEKNRQGYIKALIRADIKKRAIK